MRRKSILSSTSFRLSLVLALVLLAAFAVAGLGAWFVTKAAAERASRQRIEIEMESLLDEVRANGLDAAVATVRTRQRLPGALEYRVLDAQGRLLVGDLEIDAPAGWSQLYLPNTDSAAGPDLVILNRRTPDGAVILIAEDLERSEDVRYAILRTLSWVAVGAALLSIVMGYFATRATLRRMDDLFSTMERVDAGDLNARVAERPGHQTDIDLLGRRINETLSRIGNLVGNLRRVSSDIAHDLRTPITHLRQEVEAVQAATSIEAAKSAADAAQTKIDDISRTFEAMLRLAEIEAGAVRARFASTELADVVDRIADAYRPDIEGAGRHFEVESAPGVRVEGDADLLALAVSNLLDNALRHASSGKRIALRLSVSDACVRLDVEDDGPGIAVADRRRVLDPFVRLDASRSSGGVGLGLSIANAVAELHEGVLVLEDCAPGFRASIQLPTPARG